MVSRPRSAKLRESRAKPPVLFPAHHRLDGIIGRTAFHGHLSSLITIAYALPCCTYTYASSYDPILYCIKTPETATDDIRVQTQTAGQVFTPETADVTTRDPLSQPLYPTAQSFRALCDHPSASGRFAEPSHLIDPQFPTIRPIRKMWSIHRSGRPPPTRTARSTARIVALIPALLFAAAVLFLSGAEGESFCMCMSAELMASPVTSPSSPTTDTYALNLVAGDIASAEIRKTRDPVTSTLPSSAHAPPR
jgi:hypothetical protein